MIPYVLINTIKLGPVVIQFWGVMVALGILCGLWLNFRRAKRLRLNSEQLSDFSFWVLVGALLMARIFHVFLYHWAYYQEHLWEILFVWHGGMSVFGGFIGAYLVFLYFVQKKNLSFRKYADALVWGLPAGLAIGRLGCAFIHDHPGIYTNFILGVRYPDGVRHDLGLYLVFVNAFIFLLFLVLNKKERFDGFYLLAYMALYAALRFPLDFLRVWDGPAADARYWYLTPMQYGAIAMLATSFFLYRRWRIARVSTS